MTQVYLTPQRSRSPQWFSLIVATGLLLGLLPSCGLRQRAIDRLAEQTQIDQGDEGGLTFQNITLEQLDDRGNLLWKVQAERAVYSRDQKTAQIENPTGDLYQDGKLIFKIKSDRGEVEQDGKKISLKGQITARDVRDGTVLKGRELEWRPQEDLLIVRNQLSATHPSFTAQANEARTFSRERRTEFLGSVVAVTKNPVLRFKTEALTWEITKQLVRTNQKIQVERLQDGKVTDRATAGYAQASLKEQVIEARNNAKFDLVKPAVQVVGDRLVWNVKAETVVSEAAVTIVSEAQNLTVTGDRGQLNLATEIINLVGNVRGTRSQNQGRLRAGALTWVIPNQRIDASGSVTYSQVNPTLNVVGPRASGRLDDEVVVFDGGRVSSEVIP